jgi:phytoene desaturase
MSKVAVIGSGFSGLSAACFAARDGHSVTVYEKNGTIGGRCRFYREQGFGFDMGPSWYWMPDVFEKFFAQFGKHPSDYYQLVELDPGFQMFFGANETVKIPARLEELYALFEEIEPGSAEKLKKFLSEGKFKYEVGMQELVYKPAFSWFEFMNYEVIRGVAKSNVFKSVRSYVRGYFKDPRLVALMEFPVLFLGAMPGQIPALYTLMNYAALNLGTWYPMGGMHKIIEGMATLAESLGVEIKTNSEITRISVSDKSASHLLIGTEKIAVDGIIASSDYHHTDRVLLGDQHANYPESYWKKKTFAPSCLIFYVGVNKKINKLIHHNLFFDADLDKHAKEIYENPEWPADPLFYVCCPTKTDPSVAPAGAENLFILIPIATGLQDSAELREDYFQKVITRMEIITADTIREHIVYRKDYCVNDFVNDYHAYGGNAYGLANTLSQTAVWKPSMRNKNVNNLFYTGQLTVPGPGIPPAIISGQIAAEQISKTLNTRIHERTI